jgi:hypothetical protein
MTNKVISMNRSINGDVIKKLFAKFSSRYGQLWLNRCDTETAWLLCIEEWRHDLQDFDFYVLKQALKEAFLTHPNFPPTLGHLVNLCLQFSGIPSQEKIIALLIKREFSHPLVKILFDRIGSWTLKHAKTEEIISKIKSNYAECLINFRNNPTNAWEILINYQNLKALQALEPPKLLTKKERISFSERMRDYQSAANKSLKSIKEQQHPDFPENKVTRGKRDFDELLFAQYKAYLLAVPERLVLSLPKRYAHDRTKFLYSDIEVPRHLKESGYNPEVAGISIAPTRAFNGPKKVYSNWTVE